MRNVGCAKLEIVSLLQGKVRNGGCANRKLKPGIEKKAAHWGCAERKIILFDCQKGCAMAA